MAYKARNGKTYPYKEMPWQYRARNNRNGKSPGMGGCLLLILIILFLSYCS